MADETVKSFDGSKLEFDRSFWPGIDDLKFDAAQKAAVAILDGEEGFWDAMSIQFAETLINDPPSLSVWFRDGCAKVDCAIFSIGGDTMVCSRSVADLLGDAVDHIGDFADDTDEALLSLKSDLNVIIQRIDEAMK